MILYEKNNIFSDLTVLNLPYEFDSFGRNGNDKKLHKLIQKNARTLQSLHHLIHPISLPNEIRQKVIAINCATLRTGTLERVNQSLFPFWDITVCLICFL